MGVGDPAVLEGLSAFDLQARRLGARGIAPGEVGIATLLGDLERIRRPEASGGTQLGGVRAEGVSVAAAHPETDHLQLVHVERRGPGVALDDVVQVGGLPASVEPRDLPLDVDGPLAVPPSGGSQWTRNSPKKSAISTEVPVTAGNEASRGSARVAVKVRVNSTVSAVHEVASAVCTTWPFIETVRVWPASAPFPLSRVAVCWQVVPVNGQVYGRSVNAVAESTLASGPGSEPLQNLVRRIRFLPVAATSIAASPNDSRLRPVPRSREIVSVLPNQLPAKAAE